MQSTLHANFGASFVTLYHASGKLTEREMAVLQVVFLVGVQLDITAPQTIPEDAEVKGTPAGSRQAAGSVQTAGGEAEAAPIEAAEPSGRDLVAQRGVCGAVRVACRSLCPSAGLRRSIDDQVC